MYYNPERAPRLKSLAAYIGGAALMYLAESKFVETYLYQHSTISAGTYWLIKGLVGTTLMFGGFAGAGAMAYVNEAEGENPQGSPIQRLGRRAAYLALGAASALGPSLLFGM